MFTVSQWVRNTLDGAQGYVDVVNHTHVPKYKVYYVLDKDGNPLKGNPYEWTYQTHLEALPTEAIYTPAQKEYLMDDALKKKDFEWCGYLSSRGADTIEA